MFSFWRSCCKQLDDNPKIYLITCKHCFQQAFREIIVGILRIVTCREFQFNLEMKFYSKRCIILQVFIHLTYNVFYYKSVIVSTLWSEYHLNYLYSCLTNGNFRWLWKIETCFQPKKIFSKSMPKKSLVSYLIIPFKVHELKEIRKLCYYCEILSFPPKSSHCPRSGSRSTADFIT